MLVAIIEDNLGIRNNLVQLFEFYEYKTITANNGEEGLKLIRKYKPNIVIADIMIPVLDGFEMAKLMQSEKNLKHIPIVFLTAKSAIEDKLKGLEIGAIDFISKPFVANELIHKVRNLIELGITQVANALSKPEKEQFESSDYRFLSSLKAIIQSNISSTDLDVSVLATGLNYSTSAIHKKIKKITNKSTNQFIREFRLEKAQQMIAANHASVSEIAFSLGFSSVSYFSKSFKSFFGNSPSQLNSSNN